MGLYLELLGAVGEVKEPGKLRVRRCFCHENTLVSFQTGERRDEPCGRPSPCECGQSFLCQHCGRFYTDGECRTFCATLIIRCGDCGHLHVEERPCNDPERMISGIDPECLCTRGVPAT